MQKIGIMGVHGAGKTTLAYAMAAHFKMQEINVKLIHESVRENCPFPINSDANQGTCLWNFHTQFLNELDAEAQGYELAICDRSVLDTFVYYHAVNRETSITRAAINQAKQWLTTYDVLICLEPAAGTSPTGDGIRAVDLEYQKLIQSGFRKVLESVSDPIHQKVIFATSQDVFEEDRFKKLTEKVQEHMSLAPAGV